MGMNIMRMKGRAKMMRTIKVTGKGKIAVKPDKIRLYVNKEELCKEYEDTLRRSTEDTELLKDLFEKLGFQRKDLKTVYFNVDTEYESYQDRDKSWKRVSAASIRTGLRSLLEQRTNLPKNSTSRRSRPFASAL